MNKIIHEDLKPFEKYLPEELFLPGHNNWGYSVSKNVFGIDIYKKDLNGKTLEWGRVDNGSLTYRRYKHCEEYITSDGVHELSFSIGRDYYTYDLNTKNMNVRRLASQYPYDLVSDEDYPEKRGYVFVSGTDSPWLTTERIFNILTLTALAVSILNTLIYMQTV